MRALTRRLPAALVAALLLLGACTSSPQETSSPPSTIRPVPNRFTPRWVRLADAPSARQEVAAALVEDEVYVVGGYEAGGAASRLVDVFNIKTRRWRTGPPLPEGRHHAAAVGYGGEVYVIGGYDETNIPTATVYRFNRSKWETIAPLHHARAAAAALVANDLIHVFGGQGPAAMVAEPEEMRLSTSSSGQQLVTWTDRAPMPAPRHHLAAVFSGGFVYVVGGRARGQGGTENTTAVGRFDPLKNSWETMTALPVGRSGHGAAIIDGRIVLVGGETPGTSDPSYARVDVYDIATNGWSLGPEMPRPRHGVGVVAVEGRIYVFLGAGRAGLEPSRRSDVLEFSR